jgi:tetratricopeptide (TPR) repeat protein
MAERLGMEAVHTRRDERESLGQFIEQGILRSCVVSWEELDSGEGTIPDASGLESLAVAGRPGPGRDPLPGSMAGDFTFLRRIRGSGAGRLYLGVACDGRNVMIRVWDAGARAIEALGVLRERRRAMERMETGGIATPCGEGLLDDGRVYAVEACIEGMPLDVACEGLDQSSRLRLVAQACRRVHDLHRHLIVHRDLRPDTVRVTPSGEVVVVALSASVAAMMHAQPRSEEAWRTAVRWQGMGCVSPERADPHAAITTAQDIYSLGALLHLAATGETFKDEATATGGETGGATGGATGGETAAVVRRATMHDPSRRHASAAELASEIERCLDAAKPSLWTDAGAFAKQHRGACIGTGIAAVVMAGAFVALAASRQAVVAERDLAYEAKNNAAMVMELVQRSLTKDGGARGVRGAIESMLGAVEAKGVHAPVFRAGLHHALGVVELREGEASRASAHLRRAFDARLALLGDRHPDVAESLRAAGEADLAAGSAPDAAERFARAATILEGVAPGDRVGLARTHRLYAAATLSLADPAGAEEALSRAEALLTGASTPNERLELATILQQRAELDADRGFFDAALERMTAAMALRADLSVDQGPGRLSGLSTLARIQLGRGQHRAAHEALIEALRLEGESSTTDADRIETLRSLGLALMGMDEHEMAEQRFAQALSLCARRLGRDDRRALIVREGLIRSLVAQHQYEAAQLVLDEAVACFEEPDASEWARRMLAPVAAELYRAWGRSDATQRWRQMAGAA